MQIVQHQFGAVDRHGEAYPDAASVGTQDRGVDSDYIASRIEQRSAAVAHVDGRVCLDQALQLPIVFSANVTCQRAHHAGGQSSIQSERIADGKHLLSHLQAFGITETQPGQFFARDNLQQRQIVRFVAAQERGFVFGLIGKRHFQLAFVRHHVVVGQDLAFAADQKPGALIFGRVNLQENGAPINRARDVDRGQVCRLVDVDIVQLIGAQSGAASHIGPGPIATGLRNRLDNPALAPIGLRCNKEEAAYQERGDVQNTVFHADKLPNLS